MISIVNVGYATLLSFQLGAKKLGGGLGATKVKKDFAEIEREAEMADQVRKLTFWISRRKRHHFVWAIIPGPLPR